MLRLTRGARVRLASTLPSWREHNKLVIVKRLEKISAPVLIQVLQESITNWLGLGKFDDRIT